MAHINKRKLRKFGTAFDADVKSAVERSLKVPFESLDPALFSMDDSNLPILFYDGKAVAVMYDGKVLDINCK